MELLPSSHFLILPPLPLYFHLFPYFISLLQLLLEPRSPKSVPFNFCERKLTVCRIHALFMSTESNDDFSWFHPLRKERLKAHSVHRTNNWLKKKIESLRDVFTVDCPFSFLPPVLLPTLRTGKGTSLPCLFFYSVHLETFCDAV